MGLIHKKNGQGLVNSLINSLPIELHLPGYQFCGPGTKLRQRLERGDKGINPLDAACREHDIAYSQAKDINIRHQADKVLSEKAWQRVTSKDSDFKERANAWFVTNAMKAKLKLGMGIKNKKINTSKCKKRKKMKTRKVPSNKIFLKAVKKGINMLNKKKPQSFNEAYNISQNAIKSSFKNKKVNIPRIIPVPKIGGILPLLPVLTALGALGGIASGGSAIAKVLNDIRNGKEQLAEASRHNRYMESIAMGKGLFLKPYKRGYGLYLRPYPKN